VKVNVRSDGTFGKAIPLRYIVTICSGEAPPDDASKSVGQYPIYGSNGPIGYTAKYNVDVGTVLVGRVGASGEVRFVEQPGWATDNVLIVRAGASIKPRYLYYGLLAADFAILTTGTAQPLVTGSNVKSIRIAVPERSLQSSISTFLDDEMAEADALVARYDQLIELLEEKRVALVTQAVTKGVRSRPPTKRSGSVWIGNIPSDWEVRKIKNLGRILNGYAFDSGTYVDVGTPILRIGDILADNTSVFKRIPDNIAKLLGRFKLQKGDILLALTGATIGKTRAFALDEDVLLNQRVAAIRSLGMINAEYLGYCFESVVVKSAINLMCYGGAQDNIGVDDLGNILVPLPPMEEQLQICAFIEEKVRTIEEAKVIVQRASRLVRERCATLITHAVTGQINVRSYCPDNRPLEATV
jgi:type I restriction enzyme S subunit